MTEIKFFVYGSMSEGLVHFNKIKEFIVSKKPARVKAEAWRLKVGFPVLVDSGDDLISGEIVTLNSSDLLIGILDQFHGFNTFELDKSLYFRKTVEADTAEGVEAVQIYFLNPSHLPQTAIKINGGDWKQSLLDEPPLTSKLTEKQKQYIMKLSIAKGRDSIPCDLMSVYRPLLNMELIVDKGRRSALSKLGHEVVRYLD